jgi:hypothetical protein
MIGTENVAQPDKSACFCESAATILSRVIAMRQSFAAEDNLLHSRNIGVAAMSFDASLSTDLSAALRNAVDDGGDTTAATGVTCLLDSQSEMPVPWQSVRAQKIQHGDNLASCQVRIAALASSLGDVVARGSQCSFHEFRNLCIASQHQR